MEFWRSKEGYLPCCFPQKSRGPIMGAKAEGSFGCCARRTSLIEKRGVRLRGSERDEK